MMRSITTLSVFKLKILAPIAMAVLGSCFPLTAQTNAAQTKTAQPKTAQSRTAQTNPARTKTDDATYPPALVDSGKALFGQNCSFCHGRDAGGGETGPDLMDSDLVTNDVGGNKIGPFVRVGRPENGMPAFKLSPQEVAGLSAFLHTQKKKSETRPGGRRGVSVSDLQTGNVEAGKQYFNGAGTCSTCHSPTGDLAGVARRYRGLQLERRMLYPHNAPATVTVTLPSGQTVAGKLAFKDEFTIGLTDDAGWYRSWPTSQVKYTIDAPAEAHADLLGKYTDDDVHNLMAYLQTLR
jgi:cytochrome c oxidase cbb3-type subunit III